MSQIQAAATETGFVKLKIVNQQDVADEAPEPFNILQTLSAYKRLLSVDEVADLLGLSKFTVYRMAQKRQIPCLMIGGTRKFDPSTLVFWLTKKEPQLAAAARQLKLIA